MAIFNLLRQRCLTGVGLLLLIFTVSFVSAAEEIQFREFRSDTQIPNTNIKAGIIDVYQNESTVGKVGFKIGKDFYYIENAKPEKFNELDIFGGNAYAIFDDLFIVGTSGSPTGIGRNRWLFLLKYSGNNIKIIDALNGIEFVEDYTTIPDKMVKKGKLNILKDTNHDYKATFKIYIMMYPCGFDDGFYIFVDTSQDGLKVNLNPEFYKNLFEKSKKEPKKQELCRHLIYGFIAGYLDRNKIEMILKKKDRENSKEIMQLINNLSSLNELLHPKEQIILKKIEKEGGK